MTEWTLCRWHGQPADVAAALRGFGWCAPGEEPAAPPDPRIGGILPGIGEPLRIWDGVAYVALAASEPLAVPPGLAETGPDLSAALLGSF